MHLSASFASTIAILLLFGSAIPATSLSVKKIPAAYLTAGGGFKTMTESMGIMRAVYEKDMLPLITHFGCCSGGCWFNNQFSYSQQFYEMTLGVNAFSDYTVNQSVAHWGDTYVAAMEKAVVEEKVQDIDYTVEAHAKLCPLDYADNITELIDEVVDFALDASLFPVSDWYTYVSTFLEPYIQNVTSGTFAATRKGHPEGTIVHSITLGPDIYTNVASDREVELRGQTEGVTLLPVSFSAPAGEDGVWEYPSTDTSPLKVALKGFPSEVTRLDLSPKASIGEVSSATSSDLGEFGSPTLFHRLVTHVLDSSDRFANMNATEKEAIETALDLCSPLGLQNLSSPTDGDAASTTTSWSPKYRYLDGGYSECSGLAHTISRMQSDCLSSPLEYDCESGFRAVQVFGSAAGEYDTIPRLFANCSCGTTNKEYLGESINPQIFAEEFNSDVNSPGWTMYSNVTYEYGNANNESSVSYAWRGTVTTIENPGFGVSAGTKVDLVVLFVDDPGNPTVDTGRGADYGFSALYGEVAQEQYDSVLELLEDSALRRNLKDKSALTGEQKKDSFEGKNNLRKVLRG